MKAVKTFLVVAALSVSSSLFAIHNPGSSEKRVSGELKNFLENYEIFIPEEMTVVIRFKLTEDKKISHLSVQSEDEEVNEFIKGKLQDRKLKWKNWQSDKYYAVPVRLEMSR